MAKTSSSAIVLIVVAAAVVVGLIAFIATRSGASPALDAFAQCLTDKGVKMYGAWWCPHCAAQKQSFGGAFKKVTYVECATPDGKGQTQVCKDAGISSYPTWEFPDKSRVTGVQTFDQLAQKTGCTAPAAP